VAAIPDKWQPHFVVGKLIVAMVLQWLREGDKHPASNVPEGHVTSIFYYFTTVNPGFQNSDLPTTRVGKQVDGFQNYECSVFIKLKPN